MYNIETRRKSSWSEELAPAMQMSQEGKGTPFPLTPIMGWLLERGGAGSQPRSPTPAPPPLWAVECGAGQRPHTRGLRTQRPEHGVRFCRGCGDRLRWRWDAGPHLVPRRIHGSAAVRLPGESGVRGAREPLGRGGWGQRSPDKWTCRAWRKLKEMSPAARQTSQRASQEKPSAPLPPRALPQKLFFLSLLASLPFSSVPPPPPSSAPLLLFLPLPLALSCPRSPLLRPPR